MTSLRPPPLFLIQSAYIHTHILCNCTCGSWEHVMPKSSDAIIHTNSLIIHTDKADMHISRHTHSAVKPSTHITGSTFNIQKIHLSTDILTRAHKRHSNKCMCYKPRHRPHLEAGLTYHHLYSLLHKRRKFELEKRIYSFRTWTGVRLGQKSVHV